MAIEVTTMERPAIEAAKADAVRRAEAIVMEVRAANPDADPYEKFTGEQRTAFKGLMGDAQILAAELQRREETDDMKGFLAKHQPNKPLASLFSGGSGQIGDEQEQESGAARRMSPGAKFVTSDIYQKMQRDGVFRHEPSSKMIPEFGVALGFDSTFPVHRKALRYAERWEKALLHTESTATGAGALVIPQYDLDWEPASRPTPDILSLIPIQRTVTDTIYWMRQDTRSSAATTVSQATTLTGSEGTKPQSTLNWTRVSTAVESIAVWLPVTNQQLADVPEIRGVIDGELTYDIELELDYQLLSGNGTAPNLTGILASGIKAITYSTSTFDNLADAMLRGIVNIMTANESEPSGIVLNPIQWYVYATMKTTGSGEYLAGPPSAGAGPRTMWGLPLVVSNRIANQTGLVGNWAMARLHMREDANVKVGFVNDDFINNRVRILAELRAALTVRRPNAFCQVTALPTS